MTTPRSDRILVPSVVRPVVGSTPPDTLTANAGSVAKSVSVTIEQSPELIVYGVDPFFADRLEFRR